MIFSRVNFNANLFLVHYIYITQIVGFYKAIFKFNTLEKISSLTCPVLVTHSLDDDLIPFEMGRRLYEAAPEPKYFIELHGGHNDRDYLEKESYIKGLRKFIFPDNGV